MQKSEVETDILDVSEYLSLRLLGRDAKVKVSDVFDATKWAGNSSLLAVSNKLGWFLAGTSTGLVASPLTHLRETQGSSKGDGPTPIEPKHRISLSGAPYFVHFATSHTKVIVVVRTDDTWNLEIFNAEDICRESVGDVKPTHTLSLGGEDVLDMQPNPSEGSEVVAILRGRQSSSSCLDMINVLTGSRMTSWGAASPQDESTALTSISWSVRGKQIVVGTRGGELLQFTPEGERKQTIPPPPSLSSPQSVVSVLWLENTVFHVVYGNPNSDPSDPTHEYEVYNILFDSKANSANYVKFIDPAPPYGVPSRLSCRHYVRLVGWEPAKHLIFVADGPSTDVGAIACLNSSETEGKPSPWVTLELDETSRIALPMDDEMNETSIMGFDLDLTSTEPISNSQEAGDDAAPSPPSPILHLYTSAGLIISYHVLNSRGDKYPGMGTAEIPSAVSATPAKALAGTTSAGTPAFGVSAFGTSTTPAKPNPFGQTSATQAFGQPSTTPAATPAFGQTSAPAFGQASAFGTTSAFGSKPAFGSSTFGASSGGGFGKFTSTTPAGAPSGGGFAGFGSKPTTFGSSSAPTTNVFGSASGSTTPKTESPLSAFGSSAFGGGTSATTPKSSFGGFGSSTPSISSPVKPRDGSADPESPPLATKAPIEISPPGSPAARSDSGIDVDGLDIGGIGKKPPAGLDGSDDESEHDPTETPSKPPASTSGFAGFGKPSAFGSAASGGAFAVKPATGGAFGAPAPAQPAGGFGAFGNKAAAPSTGFSFGGGAKKDDKPAFTGGSAFGSSAFGSSGSSTPAFGSSAFGSSTSGTSTPAFGATSKPSSAFGAAPTFGTTSAPAFGATSGFGAQSKPAELSAPKSGGAFSAFAAPKPGEVKVTGGGFAGFGDAAKNKGGFLGFGDNAEKKNIFGESARTEEKKEEPKQEPASNKDVEEIKSNVKPEAEPDTPKSAFGGLTVSSPPPKPKASSPSPVPQTTKPASEAPSKIPVPRPSLLDRLSPRPESQEPTELEPPGSESSTPPGSPSPSASPPPAPPKSAPPPTPSPLGLSKPTLKPFGSTPLRSSPLATPPVTRENEGNPFNEASVKAPALTLKTSSENVTKPTSTGFFGFGKPAATEEKETKPATAEQRPNSFSSAMKGVSAASVTAGSPSVAGTSMPGATAPSAKPPSLFSGTAASPSPFSAPKLPTSTTPAPVSAAPSASKPSPFGAPGAATTPTPTSTPFSGFGGKPGALPFSAPSPSPPPSLFGQPPSTKTPPATSTSAPAPSFSFANFKPQSSTSPAATPPPPAEPSTSAPPTSWSNVEVEFNKLLEQMSAELGKLRQDTVALQHYHAQVSRANIPAPVTIQKTQDPLKWGLGDLASLKQVAGLVAKEVDGLKGLNKDFVVQMAELQPGAEKVQAKRNEIARYIKAKKDPKYTRLLKSRTSSPEHIESQTKLRKSLQIVRERTRQLEDFMATQRSRVQKQKEGRREFKVPSIDTINRTMRNIDSALSQKSDEIAALTVKVDRMKLKAPRRKASTNVAPLSIPPAENEKIKLASATALNMERSSIRLKNALLQTRTETPLNTTAVGAPVEEKPNALAKVMPPKPTVPATPAAPIVFPAAPPATSTPAPSFPVFAQPPATPNPFAPKAPAMPAKTSAPPAGFNFAPVTPSAMTGFAPLGKDEFHVTAGYEHSGRRSEKSRMHGSSAKLKTPSPNISRMNSDAPTPSPLPAPSLAPSITPAKSFFGSGLTTTPSTGRKTTPVPEGFFSFGSPSGGPVASTPPPPPKGFNFFQTPAQKAAPSSTTPVIPPVPSWATPNSSISSATSNGSVKSRIKDEEEDEEEEDDEGSEGHSGEEGEDDEEDDDDWVPGEEDEDEDDVSDGVPEGEDDEDQTARI